MCFASKPAAPQVVPAPPVPEIRATPTPIGAAPTPVIRPKSAQSKSRKNSKGKTSLRIERTALSPVGSGVNIPS